MLVLIDSVTVFVLPLVSRFGPLYHTSYSVNLDSVIAPSLFLVVFDLVLFPRNFSEV